MRPALAALALALPALAALAEAAGPGGATTPPRTPPIVFVSRARPEGDAAGQVPGLGPRGRALAVGGRLLVREPDGRLRALVPPGRFFDVSDPSVSWDGRLVAFAATVHADSAWRIWVVGADGRALRPVTRTDRAALPAPLAAAGERYDDLDPCWLPDGRICFASTRWPQRAEDGGDPATNLHTVRVSGEGLLRLTSDRNGAEEPAVDPSSGRIAYARWFVSRWLPSERDPLGVTLDRSRAVPMDTVDVWQTLSITPDGDEGRLAGGDPRTRMGVAAYQPAFARSGTLIVVRAEHAPLFPRPGRLGLAAFAGGIGAARPLAGFGAGRGSALAPAALPDGGIAFAYDPDDRGDFGLWRMDARGGRLTKLVDLEGTLELDPAPLAPRPRPPVASAARDTAQFPLDPWPATRREDFAAPRSTFRFDCLNVFANGAVAAPFADAVPIATGLRIRFYAALGRPAAAGGDTVVLLREEPVEPGGGVHVEDMPSDTPMFEQLVDASGRVLRSALGPAHVPGFNFARGGTGTKCVGCHAGHSALPVPSNYSSGRFTNVAPSAEVTASSVWPGTRARAAVDRRARGIPDSVGWVANGGAGESLALRWTIPIEVASVVLYACAAEPAAGADLEVGSCEIRLHRGQREVERRVIPGPIRAAGSRAEFGGIRADRLEVRPLGLRGRLHGRPLAALAEVETIARIAED